MKKLIAGGAVALFFAGVSVWFILNMASKGEHSNLKHEANVAHEEVQNVLEMDTKESSSPAPYGEYIEGYNLKWSDEFEGNKLDATKWGYRTDSKHWSTQNPKNVTVSDGMLFLEIKKESSRGKNYTGAGVISKKLFKYGYYESKFRVPPGAGWHTSFWLMKYDLKGGTGTKGAKQEIDICEQDSVKLNGYALNLHNWEGKHKSYGRKYIKTEDLSKSFHVWGCEFTPTHIRYYFDGKLVQETDATHLNHGEHNIWLTSIASHLGRTKKVDDSKLPSAAVFDYIRFYEKKGIEKSPEGEVLQEKSKE